jgi:transposase
MATFKKYKTGQSHGVVIDVSSYLAEGHLCKQVEKIVSTLDTSALETSYSGRGQNALHPKLMLSVIFYGYMEGIRSGRKLAKACKENLPFIYLSKGYQPKKSAINDFRKKHYTHFSGLFLQVLSKCSEAGLADASLSVVDGSKIAANSSKRRTKTKVQLEKWQQHLMADIAALEEEAEEAAKKKLASKKRLGEKISSAIKLLDKDASIEKLNLTDADGAIMKGKKGDFDTNYNTQVACCEAHQTITYCDVVTDGNDKAQLVPALKGIEENTGQKVQTALADADYGTLDSLEYMEANGICGHVPYRDMNATFEGQPFHSTRFVYDAQAGVYICPAKHILEFKSIRNDKRRNKQYRQYRTKACKSCPFQKQCVTSKRSPYRTISREVRQELRDKIKQRLNSKEGKKMYARRLHPIEAIFGHLKYNLGYTCFLLRGLKKVKAEFTLMCLAYNLRKLAIELAHFFAILAPNSAFGGFQAAKQLITSGFLKNSGGAHH